MTTDRAVAQLVRQGAAMAPLIAGGSHVVGIMERLGDGRWYWFEAGGETEFDGHVVEADSAKVLYGGKAVHFTQRGAFAGYLTTLDEAMDSEEDVARAAQSLAEWRARYDADERLRGFIVRQIAARKSE